MKFGVGYANNLRCNPLGTYHTPNSVAEALIYAIGTWINLGATQVQAVATVVIVAHSR